MAVIPGTAYWLHLRDVIMLLVARDFRGRYKHTRVGMLWSAANPLMFLLIFYFLFTRVVDLGIPHYASYVYTGILVWGWTAAALLQAVTSISANPGLVNQPGFPVSAIPVVSVLTALLNFAISFPLLLAVALLDGAPFAPALLFLPMIVAVQFLLTLSFAYLLAALNVGTRDAENILPIVLQLGYYLTPIFFDISRVPADFRRFFDFNPMVHIVGAYRTVLIEGHSPPLGPLALIAFGSAGLLVIAVHHFNRARYRFLEEL